MGGELEKRDAFRLPANRQQPHRQVGYIHDKDAKENVFFFSFFIIPLVTGANGGGAEPPCLALIAALIILPEDH